MVILSLILAFIFLSAPTDMYGATSTVEVVEVSLSQEELAFNETLIVKIQVLAKDPRLEAQTLNIKTKLFKNLGQVSFARKLSLSNNEVHQLQYYEYALKPLRIGFETIHIYINDQNFGPYSVTIRPATSSHPDNTSHIDNTKNTANPNDPKSSKNDPENSNITKNASPDNLSTNNAQSAQSASNKAKESSLTNVNPDTNRNANTNANTDPNFFAEIHLEKSNLYLNELSRYSLVLYSTEKFSQISFPAPSLPVASGMSLIPIDPGTGNNNSQQSKTTQESSLAQQDNIIHRNGKNYFSRKILEYALYPIRTGKLQIDHGDLEIRYAGETLSRPPRTKTIHIPPAKVASLSYPRANPPDHREISKQKNFSNQYGDFNIRLISNVPATAWVGEALKITLRIEGSGNFKTLIFPDWEEAIKTMPLPAPLSNDNATAQTSPPLSNKDISVYRSRRENNYDYDNESGTYHGLSEVSYTLFAQKPGTLKLPPIIFSAFSPKYQRIDSQEISLPLITFRENTLTASSEAPLPLDAIPPPPPSTQEELNKDHRLGDRSTSLDVTQDTNAAYDSTLSIENEATTTLSTKHLGDSGVPPGHTKSQSDEEIQLGNTEEVAASAQTRSRTLRTVLFLTIFLLTLVLILSITVGAFPKISRKWRQKWNKSLTLSKHPRRSSVGSVSLGEEKGLTLRATGLVLSSGSSIREIVRQTQRQLNPPAALMRDPSLHTQTISQSIAGTLVSHIPVYIEKLLTEMAQQAPNLPYSLQKMQPKKPAPPKSIRNLSTQLDSLSQGESHKSFLLSPKHIAVLKQLIELVIHVEHQWLAPPSHTHTPPKNTLSTKTKKEGTSTKKTSQVTGEEAHLLSLQDKETPPTSEVLIAQQKMALRLLRQSERLRMIRRLQLGLENLYAKSFLKWRMQLRRSLGLG